MRDKPHFLYFSSKTSRARKISISYPKIIFIVILVLVFSFFSLKYSIDFVMDFSQNSKITQLKKQNDIDTIDDLNEWQREYSLDSENNKINSLAANLKLMHEGI